MRFTSYYPSYYRFLPGRLLRGVGFIALSAALAGCSGNVTRFTDSLFTGSTPSQQMAAPSPIMADQQMPPIVNTPIETAQLPPPSPSDYDETYNDATPDESYDVAQSSPPHAQPPQNVTLGAPPRNLGTLPADETLWEKTPQAAISTTTSTTAKTYVVQSGDTLSGIASRTGTRVALIKQANSLEGDMIRIGQKLHLPSQSGGRESQNHVEMASVGTQQIRSTSPSVQNTPAQQMPEKAVEVTPNTQAPAKQEQQTQKAANTVAETPKIAPVTEHATENVATNVATDNQTKPASANPAPNAESAKTQQLAAIAPQSTGITQLRWPARGRILSSFGDREGTLTNDGLDIMVPEGTSVKAAENGVVIYAGDGLKEFGKTILIRHQDDLVTVYGHNSNLLVQRGQQVRRGDEIAKSGMSGNASSPKLHFEVRKNSSPVNPVKYLEK